MNRLINKVTTIYDYQLTTEVEMNFAILCQVGNKLFSNYKYDVTEFQQNDGNIPIGALQREFSEGYIFDLALGGANPIVGDVRQLGHWVEPAEESHVVSFPCIMQLCWPPRRIVFALYWKQEYLNQNHVSRLTMLHTITYLNNISR